MINFFKLHRNEHLPQLKLQQLRMLYGNTPNSVSAVLLGSLFAVLIFYGEVSHVRLFFWVGLILSVTAVRLFDYISFKRTQPGLKDVSRWHLRFLVGAIAIGVASGSSGMLLFSPTNITLQITLVLMIVCIASFSVTTMAPRKETAWLVLAALFVPILISLYDQHTELDRYIFWMLGLLLILLLAGTTTINTTITDRIINSIKALEQEKSLRASQDRLNLYFHNTPIALIEWNLDGRVVQWNDAAESTFGYSIEEALGKKADELIIPEVRRGEFRNIWNEVISTDGINRMLKENLTKSGQLIACQWINTALRDEEDNFIGVISYAEDVTKKLESEKVKEEFLSVVSHELRTPVTAVKGSLGLLASGSLKNNPEKTQEFLDIGLKNIDRLQVLLDDILDAEKLKLGKMSFNFEEKSLNEIVSDSMQSIQSFAVKHGVTFAPLFAEKIFFVAVDPIRIHQVITNLLSNATKFTLETAPVTVSIRAHEENLVRVSVNNKGAVIPEQSRSKLFGKFSQLDQSSDRREDGSGLGLFICQEIVKAHKSKIDFSSNAANGTTFFFDLSVVRSSQIEL